jgi:Xaa-Pro dipeptidase
MNQSRLNRVLENMKAHGLSQMIISDPAQILYMTGRMIDPEERLYALYINEKGNNKIFINNLFTVPEDLGVEKIRFSDTDNSVRLLYDCIDHSKALGIDKNFPARFLLPLVNGNAALKYELASDCVDSVRSIKDETEKELMRASSRINDSAMAEVIKSIHTGITEREVASKMAGIYRALGAHEFSFEPLVAFGKNAACGHHAPDDTKLCEGDCVLIDIGCKKDNYCSDMTRTFFYHSVSDSHRRIYEIVKKANETAESIIRPGVRFCDIDKAGRDVIEKAGFGRNFTHRIGHSIGIEDHEGGDVSLSNTDKIEEGMTFSIEPGIYIEGEVGVRIEDLVLVTASGCEILNSYTKELKVL